jgi:hypothetical protein
MIKYEKNREQNPQLETKKRYEKPRIVHKTVIETLAGSCSASVHCDIQQ